MINLIEFPNYRLASIFVESMAALLFLLTLFTLIAAPEREGKKMKRAFAVCLGLGLLSTLTDLGAYLTYGHAEVAGWFAFFCYINSVLFDMFFIMRAHLIFLYLSLNGSKRCLVLRKAVFWLYILLMVVIAFPPTTKLIYTIDYSAAMMSVTAYSTFYYLGLMVADILVFLFVLLNRKTVCVRNAVVISLSMVIPFASFIIFRTEEPPVLLSAALFLVFAYITVYQEDLNRLITNEQKQAEEKIAFSDLKAKVMLSQVKPHFVYNTLSSIARLCTKDPQRAKKLTVDFATYLRNNLDSLDETTSKFCTFETELNHIRSYLNIELVRFEDTLTVEYDIRETDFMVPVLSIQPIVENAVKHGICRKEGGGTVLISTEKVENGFQIKVKDDGVGFDPTKTPDDGKIHVGIENIKKRICLYGGKIDIHSTPGVGTEVCVFISEEEPAVC